MTTRHSPLPWRRVADDSVDCIGLTTDTIVDGGNAAVAVIADCIDAEANARLFVAAPTMLAALEEIAKGAGPYSRDPLTHAENCIDSMKALAAAAIAKARGESVPA